jgi:hypothetical protein
MQRAKSTVRRCNSGKCGILDYRDIYFLAMARDREPRQTYSSEVAERICELIIEGVSLRKICEMEHMPSRRTVFYWLKDNEGFREQYQIARLIQVEYWAHEIIEIADDTSGDFIINEHGERVVDHENINRARLKIDARKWLMSKLHPQRYGDRVSADVTVRCDMRELSDSELLQIVGRSGEPDPGREAEDEETCI